jgi:hypothetical protein
LIVEACINSRFPKVVYFSFPLFPFLDSLIHVATIFFFKLLAHEFGTHSCLLFRLLSLVYKRKNFVPWVTSPSSV